MKRSDELQMLWMYKEDFTIAEIAKTFKVPYDIARDTIFKLEEQDA